MHVLLRKPHDIVPLKKDTAVDHPAGGIHQAQDGKPGDGLAAAGLSYQSQDLAAVDAERHTVHRFYDTQFGEKIGFQVFDDESRTVIQPFSLLTSEVVGLGRRVIDPPPD